MENSNKILVINGSYRDDGITDQAIDVVVQTLIEQDYEVESVLLREYPIEFCLNCRQCMQLPGDVPGDCVLQDQMHLLVDKIEHASAIVLASPTNLGTVTAVFKRFMERLAVYAYWPWTTNYPRLRKQHTQKKPALIISSCAAPGLFGRLFYNTAKQLKLAAQWMGCKPVGSLFTGQVSKDSKSELPPSARRKARALALRLIDPQT